jgi:sterol 24-C-methyltransferase
MSLRPGMRVLDVGCGVGGPAREIAKFSGVAHITGLNLNEYQVSRAKNYAQREGLVNRLDFVQGDFMVWNTFSSTLNYASKVVAAADLT